MNNLMSLGIDKNVIDKMIAKNDYATIENIDFNIDNFKRIYNFLKDLKVNNLDELLTNYTIVFSKDYNSFITNVSEYDRSFLKTTIESDPMTFLEIVYN